MRSRCAVVCLAGLAACAPGEDPPAAAAPVEPREQPRAITTDSALTDPPPDLAKKVGLDRIATGLESPLALEVAPGDASGRLFVVERGGRIRLMTTAGKVASGAFLDLRGKVSRDHDERGLLGLAFHPGYQKNRRFYVNYTDRKGDTRVVEYKVSESDPDRADPATAREIFRLDQPYANHNGGGVEFGPDGRLWVGTGDGGAAGDPEAAGQDRKQLLAKMLRFDVDAAKPRPEIALIGLRNPWRYAFDGGDLYIGDVGQDAWEEVHVVDAATLKEGGGNLGWSVMEGTHCYRKRGCDASKHIAPAVEYDHKTGCSVTGGEVYRGAALPDLRGAYFYADFCTALVRSFRWSGGAVGQHWSWKKVLDPDFKLSTIASFGHDAAGELYIVSLDGAIFKLVAR
ncbi:MAG TPA: PQQ-dependent sugar dehydrogenase [Kofleriaceae bacterium]|nr:PQQ-dependent sugar dehydrogenase [Kofleriaceae bacterium]